MLKRLAIIPARGGSKRIKNKNIRYFCGKPMIAHILDTARKSSLFNIIHVSTESIEISNKVNELGFEIDFMRPLDLADDYTPIMPVLRFVVESYAKHGVFFDQVWLLMACAPLIEVEDLVAAEKMFANLEGKYPVLSVSEYPVPIEWSFVRNDNGELKPLHKGLFSLRSQDMETKFYDAGAFMIFPYSNVVESIGSGTDTDLYGFVLPKLKAIDIDEESDWLFAEAAYKYIFNK